MPRLLVWSAAALSLAAGQLPRPTLEPVPGTEAHQKLVKEGIALHDQGDYDGAVAKYKQVLAENPHDALALYELSYSYFAKKEYQNCIETAMQGARYKSAHLSRFYNNLGNCLDLIGRTKEALELYTAALKELPGDHMLRFNLGVTYVRLKKPEEARDSLKQAIRLKPDHPGSHLGLGSVWSDLGYRVPALFALCRFLVLEPNSGRSARAFQQVTELAGARPAGRDSRQITLSAKTDEGDFMALEILFAAGAAAGAPKKPATPAALLAAQFELALSVLAEKGPPKTSGFAAAYYAPYFAELGKRGFVEPFVYYIGQTTLAGAPEWLGKNPEKVGEFLTWSRSFQWQN